MFLKQQRCVTNYHFIVYFGNYDYTISFQLARIKSKVIVFKKRYIENNSSLSEQETFEIRTNRIILANGVYTNILPTYEVKTHKRENLYSISKIILSYMAKILITMKKCFENRESLMPKMLIRNQIWIYRAKPLHFSKYQKKLLVE